MPPVPRGARVTWLGVSTVLVDDGETALLTDGFFSRPGPLRVALGRIRPDERRIAAGLRRAGVQRLSAVFCVHSHYDHALDAPTVARLTGAQLLGSASTGAIARGHGLPPDRFREVVAGEPIDVGRFTLTALPAAHTAGDLAPGVVEAPIPLTARARRYRTGGCFSLHVRHDDRALVVHASTGVVPGALAGYDAGAVLLGIARLAHADEAFRERYWQETVVATGAVRVVPVHWDDFTRPLDRRLRPIPRPFDDVPAAMRWLRDRADADGVEYRLPVLGRPVPLQ